jgi:hypothetical protein
VQWKDIIGDVEYQTHNESITDLSPFQVYVDRWVAAASPPPPPDPPIDLSDLDNMEKAIKVLALCIAGLNGITNAQMKTLFKQKWDSLP